MIEGEFWILSKNCLRVDVSAEYEIIVFQKFTLAKGGKKKFLYLHEFQCMGWFQGSLIVFEKIELWTLHLNPVF